MLCWYIVEFDEDCTEIVPDIWLKEDGKKALCPSYRGVSKITNAIKGRQAPGDDWTAYDVVRIFSSAGNYDEAQKKLQISKYNSDVSDEYLSMQDKTTRSQRHKKPMTDSESEQNEVIEGSGSGKISVDDFPEYPGDKSDGDLTLNVSNNAEAEINTKLLNSLSSDHSSNSQFQPLNETANDTLTKDANFGKSTTEEVNHEQKNHLYLVVMFADNNEHAVIPSLWLIDENNCFWPPHSKHSTALVECIERRDQPGEHWRIREISKTLQNADNFETAIEKYEATIKISANQMNSILSTQSRHMDTGRPKVQIKSIVKTNFALPNSNIPQPSSATTSSTRRSLTELQNLNEDDRFLYVTGMLTQILENQAEEKMRYRATSYAQTDSNISTQDLEDLNKLFPIKEVERFLTFNEELTDKIFERNVKALLRTVGGRSGHFTMRNMLKKIMTTDVAIHFSFVGRTGKRAFQNHRIWKTLVEVAVSHKYTLNEAEETTKNWLKEAIAVRRSSKEKEKTSTVATKGTEETEHLSIRKKKNKRLQLELSDDEN